MELKVICDYGQICIFDPQLEKPFNDWEAGHNKQGFSWRKNSVSFAVPDVVHEARVNFTIHGSDLINFGDFVRVIQVPFEIGSDGVEIGGVLTSQVYDAPPGQYVLTFGIFKPGSQVSLYLGLKQGVCEAKILLADENLDPESPLCLDANPA